MNKLKTWWSGWRSSLWFVPTVMVTISIALALGLIEIDSRIKPEWLNDFPRTFGAGADGSRGMLSAIAGSMITVAGLTFSLTLAAIAQTSSQYTSRVLRNFMRDRTNQFVLGSFVSIFAYCLIVLRTIRGGDEGRFIPSIAVLFGLLLALLSIGVLILFIHHIASSLQASTIISKVADETSEAIEHLFPTDMGDEADEAEKRQFDEELAHRLWQTVTANRIGYIQGVDVDALFEFAREHQIIIRMEHGIGDFLTEKSPLVSIAVEGEAFSDDAKNKMREIYNINHFRTVDQDVEFGVRQIVDIAMKALSPGINDTTTAIFCVDYLGAILEQLACRRIETPYRKDGEAVRLVSKSPTFAKFVATAFDQIRINAEGNAAILERQLKALINTARCTKTASRTQVLRDHVRLIAEQAARTLETDYEKAQVRVHLVNVLYALEIDVNDSDFKLLIDPKETV